MLEGLNNIYNRINAIKDGEKSLQNLKPEAVKEFQEMYKNALSKNTDKSQTKNDNDNSIHPLLQKNNIEKTEKLNTKVINSNEKMNMIDNAVKKASQKYKISEDLIRSVIQVESNYDPYAISKAGAMGLMQLIPKTSLEMGVENPFDIEDNIDGGSKYLRLMLDKYNHDIDKSLAAYNAGPQEVDKVDGIPNINETKNYVEKIKKLLFK